MAGAPVARTACADDADAVQALAADMAVSFAADPAAFATSFAAVLGAADAHMLVVDVNGRVSGYLLGIEHPTFYANGPVAWIEETAVRASLRRRGLGSLLIRDFEDRVRRRGCRLVALATSRADAFYAALGYERRATYYRISL